MNLVVVTGVTSHLLDIRREALLIRIELVGKSYPHGPQFRPLGKENMKSDAPKYRRINCLHDVQPCLYLAWELSRLQEPSRLKAPASGWTATGWVVTALTIG